MMSQALPMAWPRKKWGVWIFIFSDAVTFSVMLFAYGYVRISSPNWTEPFAFSTVAVNGAIMTLALLTSSLTMIGAVLAAQAGRKGHAARWMGATMVLGLLFAGIHVREWLSMIGAGWRLFANPAGGSVLFGASYFSITGFHLLHVIAGVIVIAVVAIGFKSGRLNASHVEATALYWHFVDLVWMFVFPMVYLMNVR